MNSSNTSKNTLWDNEMINYAKKKHDKRRFRTLSKNWRIHVQGH